MQLGSLLDPKIAPGSGRRTISQKWRQLRAARALERTWTKDEILEAYFNLVDFRGELQGVAAATRGLFDKAPHGLSNDEALVLAALIPAPNLSLSAVESRALRLSRDLGRGDFDEIRQIIAGPLARSYSVDRQTALAPHLARRLLSHSSLKKGLRSVETTLDRTLQSFVVDILHQRLSAVRDLNVADGAVLVVENPTGNVMAYVGGSGNLSSARYVDGVVAQRQAGSTLKPFLYAQAIDERLLTAASLLDDTEIRLPVSGGIYRPENYDKAYHGLVTARIALASSLNIPAVQVAERVGVERFVSTLEDLGFRTLVEPEFYGPSIALGSADVTLWDLVGAYRALANGGVWGPLTVARRAAGQGSVSNDDSDGTDFEADLGQRSGLSEEDRVFGSGAAYIVSQILSDRESRSPTFGLESPLSTRFWSAVKTGTSKDMRDNWCVGYSSRYTVGVWVGNFSGRPMWNVSGISGAAPIWLDVMNRLHASEPSHPPLVPLEVEEARVRFAQTGTARSEYFLSGTRPLVVNSVPSSESFDRVLEPTANTIFAIDPDIPQELQRIFFRSQGGRGRIWRLDGEHLASAEKVFYWPPTNGPHLLQRLDSDGLILDAVRFEVRGASSEQQAPGNSF